MTAAARIPAAWTPAAKARVCELWTAGTGGTAIADAIAAEFGIVVTKSAVIGVAHRAGLGGQGPRSLESLAAARAARDPNDTRERRREKKRLAKAAAKAARPAEASVPSRPAPRPVPAAPVGLPVSLGVPLVAAREGQCRFIADDPKAGPALVCGHPCASGSAWCAGHRRICTVPDRRRPVYVPNLRRAA